MPRWLWIVLGLFAVFFLLIGSFGAGVGIGYAIRGDGLNLGCVTVALIRVEGPI